MLSNQSVIIQVLVTCTLITCITKQAQSTTTTTTTNTNYLEPDATSAAAASVSLYDFYRRLGHFQGHHLLFVCNETGHSVALDDILGPKSNATTSSTSVNVYSGELEPQLGSEPAATATTDANRAHRGGYHLNASSAVEVTQAYVDEMKHSFKVLVWDRSVDERLANLVYLISAKTVIVTDAFRFNSGSREQDQANERLVAAGAPIDRPSLCGQHLEQMLESVDELGGLLTEARRARTRTRPNASSPTGPKLEERHLRLARVLDSYGRYESGFLTGRLASFGSYNQCRNTALLLGPERAQLVGSRYCWARLSVEKHLSRALKLREREHLEPTATSELSVGICLPETCHTGHFSARTKPMIQRLVDSQFKLPESIYLDESLEVKSIFCTVDERSQVAISASGRLLLSLLTAWLLLACYVTWNYQKLVKGLPEGKLRESIRCLNIRDSWLEFLGKAAGQAGRHNERRRVVELNALNPVRCLGCMFVVWAHTLMAKHGYSIEHLDLPKQFEESMLGGFVVVNSSVVDTFFVITGIIVAYLTMRRATGPRSSAPAGGSSSSSSSSASGTASRLLAASLSIVKTRYLRLAPLMLLVYWFKRSVFIYLGSGPLWDHGFNRETLTGACQEESWLVALLLATSFKPLSRQCLMQSWSVSNDMVALTVLAPLLVVMTRRPRLAFAGMLALAATSQTALLAAIRGLKTEDAWALRDLRAQGIGAMFARVSHIYASPNYRISALIVGVLAGYVLHWYEQQQQRLYSKDDAIDMDADETRLKRASVWPRWFVGPVTYASFGYIGAVLLLLPNAPRFREALQPHHTLLFPFFMTVGKVMWSASNAVLFLRMVTDWNGSFLMRASSDRFWQVLSRLNYAVLLVHFDLILYDITVSLYPDINNAHTITRTFSLVYLASLLVGALLHVLFENPVEKLIKRLVLQRASVANQQQPEATRSFDGPSKQPVTSSEPPHDMARADKIK